MIIFLTMSYILISYSMKSLIKNIIYRRNVINIECIFTTKVSANEKAVFIKLLRILSVVFVPREIYYFNIRREFKIEMV